MSGVISFESKESLRGISSVLVDIVLLDFDISRIIESCGCVVSIDFGCVAACNLES